MAGLSLERVVKTFGGVRALHGLTLDVDDGELLVLVGPSGCGKTTALRVIAGLEPCDEGTIRIGARDVTRVAPADRDVALVFQSYALFPHMSVFDNLAFGLAARRAPEQDILARVTTTAEALGLSALLERKPRQLSGGERQRVALGRAMVREPAVFLMDEPLSNLDAQLRTQTRAEIVRLQAGLGTTTVYVTHDQIEALSIGHRVGVMRGGTLEQLGAPHEVYARPASLFVARFIGSPPMNVVAARRDGDVLVWDGGRLPAPPNVPRECLLGVRPEHVHVLGSRWSARAHPGELFRARVDLVESVGDQALLTLDAGGAIVVARVEPSFRTARGETVEAWFDPEHLHVFDPDTKLAQR